MGKVLRAVVLLLVALAGLAFHARNHAPLSLDFYAFRTVVPASWLGVGGLVLGVALGVLAMLPEHWRLARQLKRRTRELELARSALPPATEPPASPLPPPV
ncbi:MAG TPA: lipopolysaccharide assembly protein LapA domain-containing protein [Gammaproteobacteria bacterium]|nr:lipopolysaccharide assembly protein LapA domain-containing protein [Gammaproteobacteria bacterium]